jgi:hypothetical protein
MAVPSEPNVICTPYVGRTIKGWTVRVRVCFSLNATALGSATLSNDLVVVNQGIAALIQNLTVAHIYQPNASTGMFFVAEVPYGSSGNYDDAEDSAVLSFATANGTVGRISIPAPKSAIFLADLMTVNPAQTDVAAFVTAVTSGAVLDPVSSVTISGWYGSTKSGAYYATLLGGLRVRRRTRRKMNIWIKDPTVTIPAI